MKTCFKCDEEKPLSEFYKHEQMGDGHLGKCKECTKNDVKTHRAENLEKAIAYDRSRNILPHRVEARKEYAKTDRGREVVSASHKRYKDKYPEKFKAHSRVGNAIKSGKLTRPDNCGVCGVECVPHGHHWSYEEEHWLDVEWVCIHCHIDIHKGE
jgi:hypothetical protein